ncbi:dCTP deaminase, dUMP-forming [subsurface metagenome]
MVFLPPFSEEIFSEYINEEIQTQIAGFDLTTKEVMKLKKGGILDFDNNKRHIPEYKNINSKGNKWILKPGGYLIRYNEIIQIPKNSIGLVLPRSSLMRCGATLCSAVWDPGYKGRGIGLLIVTTKITLYENTRIAQIILIKTEKSVSEGYSGTYQNENT